MTDILIHNPRTGNNVKLKSVHTCLTKNGYNWTKLTIGERTELYRGLQAIRYCKCGCGKTVWAKRTKYARKCYAKLQKEQHKEGCSCCICKARRHENIAWNKGLTKGMSDRVRRIGAANSKHKLGKTYEEIFGEKEGKRLKEVRREQGRTQVQPESKRLKMSKQMKGKPKSAAHKEKLSNNWDKNHPPECIEKMGHNSRSNYLNGHYFSRKNNTKLFYQSSYELKALKKLEKDSNVISFKRCNFIIPYIFEGEQWRYFPDFLVTHKDKSKVVIEVKPRLFLETDTLVITKAEAGLAYCDEKNYTYRVWCEEHLT